MTDNLVKSSILDVIKKNIVLDILLFLSACGAVLISLIPPQILKYIIDSSLLNGQNSKLLSLAILYMVALLFIGIFDFMKEAVLTIVGQKITKEIRIRMMGKIERINAKFFLSNESGIVVSRFTNDVDAINQMFASGILGMIVDCFKVVGIIISIWMFSSKLGLTTLVIIPIIYFITRSFQKRMLKAQIDNRVLVGIVNNHISESVKNILMIKSFSNENYMEKKYTQHLLRNYNTIEKVNFYDSIFSPIIQIIRAIAIAIIVVVSYKQLDFIGISLGMVAASIELMSNLFAPIENLGMELQGIQQAISGIYRVNEFYNISEDDNKNEELIAEEIIKSSDDIKISFNNLSFQYQNGAYILQNISFQINSQEKVAFIGRTGVGKSTLFKLVMGLLKPTDGNIEINGVDVYDIPNIQKRRIFGYVDQNFKMIDGTVADQITLFDESITKEQVRSAIEFVLLEDFVASLDNGIDTMVGGDNIFSQGQRQLLAIARAIVTSPPILLLDEITANLDSITEEKIVSVLQKAGKAHTILSVSHRLSSVIASDRIVILENGKIKNVGTAELLIQEDDWYSSHIALEKMTWC